MAGLPCFKLRAFRMQNRAKIIVKRALRPTKNINSNNSSASIQISPRDSTKMMIYFDLYIYIFITFQKDRQCVDRDIKSIWYIIATDSALNDLSDHTEKCLV